MQLHPFPENAMPAVRRNSQGRPGVFASLVVLLLSLWIAPQPSAAADGSLRVLKASGRYATIPHNAALQKQILDSGIQNIAVQFDGLAETLDSYSRILLHDLTGRETIGSQHPVYSVLSMVYEQDRWVEAELFPLDHPSLAVTLKLDPAKRWISVRDYLGAEGREQLHETWRAYRDKEQSLTALRDLRKALIQARISKYTPEQAASIAPKGLPPEMFAKMLGDEEAYNKFEEKFQGIITALDREKATAEPAGRLINRVQHLMAAHNTLLLVPNPLSLHGEWTPPWDSSLRDERARKAGADLDAALQETFKTGSAATLGPRVATFLEFASKQEGYPSELRRSLRTFYVEARPFERLAWIYLVAVLLMGISSVWKRSWLRTTSVVLLGATLLLHTGTVALRLFLSGHMPVSNMYESITFTSWAIAAIGLTLGWIYRQPVFGGVTGALGFLSLTLVDLMPLHQQRITALRAVLNSYWLNIHVTMMLISYAALLIGGAFAAIYLVREAWGRTLAAGPAGPAALEALQPKLDTLELFAYRCTQVGWPLLTVGIFLGGVWAETAWGRFWGWDPKETWALITWCVYTAYLHTRMVMGWRGRMSAIACVVGFVAVLVTWLGVSYLPGLAGGLHSYASPK